MAWLDPKTNYESTDKFNAEDYNRIIGNIQHLADRTAKLKTKPDIIEQEEKDAVGYTSLIYAADFNNIVDNINTVNAAAYNNILEDMRTYEPGGSTPHAADVNIIEGNILKMSKNIDADYNALTRIDFVLGNYGGIKC